MKATKNPGARTVFSVGMIFGLIGWAAIPGMLFTSGQNDSNLALLLMFSCLFLFMPLCLVAFWKLRFAGFCFLLLTVMWTASVFVQYHFEESRGRHGAGSGFGLLIYSVGFLWFGLFALKVDRRQSLTVTSEQSSGTESP